GNPYPNYGSDYANKYWYSQYSIDEKNWLVHYPFIPSISCSDTKSPANISYTPYETRKGTITLSGKNSYDPSSGQEYFDTTSQLLQSVSGAREFFWGDSTLKIRFKAN